MTIREPRGKKGKGKNTEKTKRIGKKGQNRNQRTMGKQAGAASVM